MSELPPDIEIERAPEGRRVEDLLLAGEIDALVEPGLPEARGPVHSLANLGPALCSARGGARNAGASVSTKFMAGGTRPIPIRGTKMFSTSTRRIARRASLTCLEAQP